jgi:hypothetical protein
MGPKGMTLGKLSKRFLEQAQESFHDDLSF